jgi:type III pantothenate kinase
MIPSIVVDVGNSRIKWGRCAAGAVAEAVSLPPDEPDVWLKQLESWRFGRGLKWAVCGVHPLRRDRFIGWLNERGDDVLLLKTADQLPLRVNLEHPDRVGIDRLMDAVAAKQRSPGAPAIIVDAGSAVTVDWIDAMGTFGGGAIFPGLRLMVEALHNFTALLPRIEIKEPRPPLPATSTPAAMEAGIFWSVIGGVNMIASQMETPEEVRAKRFLTGGDAEFLHPALGNDFTLWPAMTLEGIRIAAEAQP